MESLLTYFETLPVWSKALWLVACFSLGGALEVLIPFKSFHYQKPRHILFNLSFLLFIIPINLCFGLILVSTSAWIEHYHLGLFNQFSIPLVTQLIVAVLAFDYFSQYCTHVLLHKVNWLWRIHIVHLPRFHVIVGNCLSHLPSFSFRQTQRNFHARWGFLIASCNG